MRLLAEFEFKNDDFELIEEAKDDVYVKIERECRITPFVGMKQPTPTGGMLGYEVVLTIKYLGEIVSNCPWEILQNDTIIAATKQVTWLPDINITYRSLPIPIPYGCVGLYKIKIYHPIDMEISEYDINL